MSREEDEQMDYRMRSGLSGIGAALGDPNLKLLHRRAIDQQQDGRFKQFVGPIEAPKPAPMTGAEVCEITIRLIHAIAGLLAAVGVFAIGLAVVWLVRGA